MVLLSRHTLVQGLRSLRHKVRHTTNVSLPTRLGEICDRVTLGDNWLLFHSLGPGDTVHACQKFVVRPSLHGLADVDNQIGCVSWLHRLEVVMLASILTLQPTDAGLEEECNDS